MAIKDDKILKVALEAEKSPWKLKIANEVFKTDFVEIIKEIKARYGK